MWREEVQLETSYHIEEVMYRLSLDPLNAVNQETKTIKVPLLIDGAKVVATVQHIGSETKPHFLVESNGPKEKVMKKVSHIFQWEEQFEDIHAHFASTPFASLFKEFAYTPIIQEFHPFDCLIRCIIHQQLNLKFAITLTERFVKQYGEQVDGVWFYPTPEVVATLTVEELRTIQFSTRKAEYVIDLAQDIVNGNLDLHILFNTSNEEVEKILIKRRGIGPWTVQNFLLFTLGRKNIFPIGDVGLQNALKNMYRLEGKPSKEQIHEIIDICSPYSSYAALYLWKSLEK
ncbi:DNA-3-methyladenine glycosylase family protein [Priestia taiwanensis]|uniref:DNA-3-methyladenine glycosylase II n=1 Tax=Priestia taiwanensis TaxID=1347902 RepID=A0A917ETJ4_9BACI|nr:DNA-3-methyladenine glycosylase [Priestia taiwanensis]GGE78681.1 DNA-3-methyladenine glycosylase II [Priestia taiwanensis]